MYIRSLAVGTALTTVLSSVPALADLTAQDVWNDWKTVSATQGQTLAAASERMAGDTLVLTDVTVSMMQPDIELTGTIDEIRMLERGDGSVTVTMTPEMPFDMKIQSAEDETIGIRMVIRQGGTTMTASGDPETMRYDYLAPNVEIVLEDFSVDGESVTDTELDFNFNVALNGIAGNYTTSGEEPRNIDADMRADNMTFDIDFSEPGTDMGVKMDAEFSDLEIQSTGTIANLTNAQALGAMIKAGLRTQGGYTYGPATYDLQINSDDGAMRIAGGASGGNLDVVIDENGIEYGGLTNDVAMSISGDQIPFPQVNFAIEEYGGLIRMPIGASDEAEDFGLQIRLVGLAIDDMIWSIFDAGGVLPRDPFSVIMEFEGRGNWLIDITDPEALEAMEESPEIPGEIESLNLTRLLVTAGGAELNGTGAFTFSDGPVPMPEGSATFNLIGANGLMDKLVAMGLMPEDQAMGARMMLGIFARPGNGADTLTSVIEVNPDGSVLANGQRIK
ncbi:MAG: DUF2125 domain-containing protein [Rhodobacteraceae bacterium]|nr:DUF2125 domain-containing protein [Paracoccaceae bacterium]